MCLATSRDVMVYISCEGGTTALLLSPISRCKDTKVAKYLVNFVLGSRDPNHYAAYYAE